MEKVTAKWFHTVCQIVEDKRMSVLEIMYLVFKSLWILVGDHDLFCQENITQYIWDMQNSNEKSKDKNKILRERVGVWEIYTLTNIHEGAKTFV